MPVKKPWTEADLAKLRHLYPDNTGQSVATALGRGIKSVYGKAHELDLKKSAEFFSADASGRVTRGKQHPAMVASQFKKGLVPWNAGRAGWQAGGRAKETQFKPGGKPHTTLPVGSYRLCTDSQSGRKVLEQKFSEAPGGNHKRWAPVSRLVWEAAHGPVPKGHIVVFKPGTFTTVLEEITLDKLECISRADNARRNHSSNKSPELAKLVQLKGAITRQVNRIAREHAESHP